MCDRNATGLKFIGNGPGDTKPMSHSYIIYLCVNSICFAFLGKLFIRFNLNFHMKCICVLVSVLTTLVIIYLKSNVLMFFYMSPKLMMFVSYPLTILRVMYQLDLVIFRKEIFKILLLVYLGTTLYSLLIGTSILLIAQGNFSWDLVPLYGFAVGSIDYVGLGPRGFQMDFLKNTLVILEVESILGSDLCYAVMTVSMKLSKGLMVPWYMIVKDLVIYFLGGVLFGFISGQVLHLIAELFYDSAVAFSVFMVMTTICIFTTADYLSISSILSTFLYCYYLSSYRVRIPFKKARLLRAFFSILNRITLCSFLFIGMFLLCLAAVQNIARDNLLEYFTLLLVGISARFLVLLILYPIFRMFRFSYNLTQIVMMSWLTKKGLIQIIYFLNLLGNYKTEKMANYSSPHTFIFIALTIVLNSITMNLFLRIFGISNVPRFAIINMNYCMYKIRKITNYFISMMRMNSLLADVNWKLVNEHLSFEHPYGERDMASKDDREMYTAQTRYSFCVDCNKTIFFEPTLRELKLHTIDAKQNILKAHKMSFTTQFEKGMISKDVIRILSRFIEIALTSKDLTLDPMFFKEYIYKETLIEKFKALVVAIEYKEPPLHPRIHWRKIVNKIVMHLSYEIFFIVISMLGVSIVFVDLVHDDLYLPCTYSNLAFLLLIMIDCTLKIISYSHLFFVNGIRYYFGHYWDILDYTVILTTIWDLSCDLLFYLWSYRSFKLIIYRATVKSCSLLRVCKLLKFMLLLSRHKVQICRKLELLIGQRQMLAVDIGQAMINSYEEVLHAMSKLIEHQSIRDGLIAKTMEDESIVTRELGSIKVSQSFIAGTSKTRKAIRNSFFAMKLKAKDLLDKGLMNKAEHTALENATEKCLHQFLKMNVLSKVDENLTSAQVGYLDQQFVSEYLWVNSSKATFKPGQSLLVNNQLSGIFIIISGSVNISYHPQDIDTYQRYGALPGLDQVEYKYLPETTEYYLVCGSTMGEMGCLTGRSYQCEIIAHKECTVLIIPQTNVLDAINTFDHPATGLHSRMWLYLTFPIINSILWETSYFQSFTKDDIYDHTKGGFIPDLKLCDIFRRSSSIEDIVLVEGIVLDMENDCEYIAPCHLPRYVREIKLIRKSDFSVEPQLFILPLSEKLIESIVQPIRKLWLHLDSDESLPSKKLQVYKPAVKSSNLHQSSMSILKKTVSSSTFISNDAKKQARALFRSKQYDEQPKNRTRSSFAYAPMFAKRLSRKMQKSSEDTQEESEIKIHDDAGDKKDSKMRRGTKSLSIAIKGSATSDNDSIRKTKKFLSTIAFESSSGSLRSIIDATQESSGELNRLLLSRPHDNRRNNFSFH